MTKPIDARVGAELYTREADKSRASAQAEVGKADPENAEAARAALEENTLCRKHGCVLPCKTCEEIIK